MIMRIDRTDDDHRGSLHSKGRAQEGARLVVEDPEAERGKDGRETWSAQEGKSVPVSARATSKKGNIPATEIAVLFRSKGKSGVSQRAQELRSARREADALLGEGALDVAGGGRGNLEQRDKDVYRAKKPSVQAIFSRRRIGGKDGPAWRARTTTEAVVSRMRRPRAMSRAATRRTARADSDGEPEAGVAVLAVGFDALNWPRAATAERTRVSSQSGSVISRRRPATLALMPHCPQGQSERRTGLTLEGGRGGGGEGRDEETSETETDLGDRVDLHSRTRTSEPISPSRLYRSISIRFLPS